MKTLQTISILAAAGTLAAFGANAQIITTVTGGAKGGDLGDGGPATQAVVASEGVAVDTAGNLYIADTYQHRVRRVNLMTGVIATIAGDGNAAFNGDGGPATKASLWSPGGVAADNRGSLYISDTANHRVRRLNMNTGIITTIAGDGRAAFQGDGGAAIRASLQNPTALAIEGTNLYIADSSNARVRRVDLLTGLINTVAGGGDGGLLQNSGPVQSMTLHNPSGIALDGAGNLYVAERYGHRVVRVSLDAGSFTTVAGGLDGADDADNIPASTARLNEPMGVAVGNGELFVLENRPSRVRRISLTTGLISAAVGTGEPGFSGDGGPAILARLDNPKSIAWSAGGDLFIADTGNWRIRRVSSGAAIRCPAN